MREISFEYWKQHSDSVITVEEIISNLIGIIEENGKIGAIEEDTHVDNQLNLF